MGIHTLFRPTGNSDSIPGYDTKNVAFLLDAKPGSNPIQDSSPNGFTITKNYGVTPSSLSPLTPTGYWSGYFDGSGDYLALPNNAAFNLSNGEFTIEFWINPPTLTDSAIYRAQISNVATNAQGVVLGSSGVINFFGYNGSSSVVSVTSATGAIVAGQWSHVAIVRSGNNTQIYINGTASGAPSTTNYTIGNIPQTPYIGIYQTVNPSYPFLGYLSNFRFVKGTAVYTSNFTPSTTPLTAISGTSLLCLQDNRFIDNSTNNFTITKNADSKTVQFNPFLTPSGSDMDSESEYGGSFYFNGSQDFLTIEKNTVLDPGTGDFCFDSWVYFNALTVGNIYNGQQSGISIALDGSSKFAFGKSYVGNILTSTTIAKTGQWYHVAVCRSGTTLSLFINGVREATIPDSTEFTTSIENRIGWNGSTAYFNGYISNMRIVKGSSIYDPSLTTLTIPTRVFSPTSNTSLLLTGKSRQIFDVTNNIAIEPIADASSNNVISKYDSYSTYFDGNGDYLKLKDTRNLVLGTSNFTIEFWMYPKDVSSGNMFDTRPLSINGLYPALYLNSGTVRYYVSSTDVITSESITANAWYHVALVRKNTFTNLYINGQVTGSPYKDINNYLASTICTIGASSHHLNGSGAFFGHIQDFKITRGESIYGNFEKPTEELDLISNTVLLLKTNPTNGIQNYNFLDSSQNGVTVSIVGDPVQTSFNPYVPNGYWSGYFNGSTDYLSTPNSDALRFTNATSFTIELWIYRTVSAVGQFLITNYNQSSPYQGYGLAIGGDSVNNQLQFWDGGSWRSFGAIATNTWTHIAVSYEGSGTTGRVFVDGIQVGSAFTVNANINYTTGTCYIGTRAGLYNFPGYISNLNIIKNQAKYTSNFIPPSAPLSAIAPYNTEIDNDTTLLLTTNNTNGAQNNTFLDSSANAFSITRNGDTTQGSFNPYMPTGYWSGYFDGNGDFLNFTDSSNVLDLGGVVASVEFWIYPLSNSGAGGADILLSKGGGATNWNLTNGVIYQVRSDNGTCSFAFNNGGGVAGATIISSGTVVLYAWNHIAVATDASNNISLYLNGTRVATATNAISKPATRTTVRVGNDWSGNFCHGYISNMRFVTGAGAIDPTASAITVPTAPLTAITNTSLLCLQDNRFKDNSSNAFAITVNGDTRISKFAPFNQPASYSTATYGGSGYFDGDGDFLSFTGITLNGDFSAEAWFYKTANPSVYTVIFGGSSVGGGNNNQFSISNTGALTLVLNATVVISAAGTAFVNNQWNHVVWARKGTGTNNCAVYVNGVRQGTGTSTTNVSVCSRIGDIGNLSGYRPIGYISNLRLVVGNSAYDTANATITVPTAPLTAIAGTSLLLNFDNAGIYDITGTNNLQTVGNVQVSTAQAKFGTTSMYFSGGLSYLLPNPSNQLDFGVGPFTIEFWMKADGAQYPSSSIMERSSVAPLTGTDIQIQIFNGSTDDDKLSFYVSDVFIKSTTSVNTGEWFHIACVRVSATTSYLFINGVLEASSNELNTLIPASMSSGRIGRAQFNDLTTTSYIGWIDGLRITKGYARYTSNFVPAQYSEFENLPTTSLLCLQDNIFIDRSLNNSTISVNSEPDNTVFSPYTPTTFNTIKYGGSGYFSSDYLSIADSELFEFGNGDLTAEAWIYPTAYSSAAGGSAVIFAKNSNISNLGFYLLLTGSSTSFTAISWSQYYSGVSYETSSGSFNFKLNNWYHVAATKSNGSVRIFVNGVQVNTTATFTQSQSNSGAPVTIGGQGYTGANYYFTGHISTARLIKGFAAYTSNFVPSSAPVSAVEGTSLLINFNNAGIYDKSNINKFILSDTTQTSTTAPKFGASSMYFDGTGDGIYLENNPALYFDSNPFTIEFWMKAAVSQDYFSVVMSTTGASEMGFSNGGYNSYKLQGGISGQPALSSITVLNDNTWHHVAIQRDGTRLEMFIDGVLESYVTISAAATATMANGRIGRWSGNNLNDNNYTGWLQDVRFVNGRTIYSSNFTPPTRSLITIQG